VSVPGVGFADPRSIDMATFLISYDLHKPGRDYSELYRAIGATGSFAHPLESVWLVTYNGTTAQLRDALMKHVDSNDDLLVAQLVPGTWATYGVNAEAREWMRNNA
jgi:hypothetical protein